VVWYGMVWYGMVWYGMVWYGRYGTFHSFPPPPVTCHPQRELGRRVGVLSTIHAMIEAEVSTLPLMDETAVYTLIKVEN
jgi:hypothetical protein